MKQKESRATSKNVMLVMIKSLPYTKLYAGKKRRFVIGVCECGNEIEMIYSPISKDYPKSCGCAKLVFKERAKAAKMRSSYRSMRERCYNLKHDAYRWYGANGVLVCERWLKGFKYFYEDMEKSWFVGAQLDRHPNKKGNYDPRNCRWATSAQQQREKSNSKITEKDAVFIRESNLKQKYLAEMFGVRDSEISRIKNNKRWKL